MKKSFWDNSIFKKFSSVSHFRLLSQLSSELKTYPITRNKIETKIKSSSVQTSLNSSEEVISKASPENSNNHQASKKSQKNLYSNIDTINNNRNDNLNTSDDFNRSFKERLRDIDMK